MYEDDIKMDIREVGFGVVVRVNLAKESNRLEAIVNTEMKFRIPHKPVSRRKPLCGVSWLLVRKYRARSRQFRRNFVFGHGEFVFIRCHDK